MSITGWAEGRWVVGLLVVTTVFCLVHRLERHIRARGTLFPRSRPRAARRLALLLGLFVTGFCTVCWLSGVQLYGFILLGVALVGYGLDYGALLGLLQGRDDLAIPAAAEREGKSSPVVSRRRAGIHHDRLLNP